jgi:hypothetical protein
MFAVVSVLYANITTEDSMDGKSFLIGALIVALLAGGYFYHDSTRSQVRIDAGGVKVQAD